MSSQLIVTSSAEKNTVINLLFKLTVINLNNSSTKKSLKIKCFLHIEIVSKTVKSQTNVFSEVKRFLCIEILKRKQKEDDSDLNESIIKIFRVMLILTALTANDKTLESSSLK